MSDTEFETDNRVDRLYNIYSRDCNTRKEFLHLPSLGDKISSFFTRIYSYSCRLKPVPPPQPAPQEPVKPNEEVEAMKKELKRKLVDMEKEVSF